MNIKEKKLIIFDLDGTLAPSKSALEQETAILLSQLIQKIKVAIISGGGYPQFETQFLNSMPGNSDSFSNLYLLPTSGTRLYIWRGTWCEEYAEHLSQKQKESIMSALNYALKTTGYERPDKSYGPLIEDRGSQITFSALGQKAPLDLKLLWDPSRAKRIKIADILKSKIPEFDVRIGGTTSVDITKRGVNKAYGIRKLEDFLKISINDMVFVGDALYHGGNDHPAKATGVDCIPVEGPADSRELMKVWLKEL